jgi:hypothetical protein
MFPYNLSAPPGPVLFFLELEALVAWPRDPEAQKRFLCAISGEQAEFTGDRFRVATAEADEAAAGEAQQWHAAWEGMFQRSGGRRRLVHTPTLEAVQDEFLRASHKAYLAGRVLDVALQLASDPCTRAMASINMAKEIVHRDLPDLIPTVRPMPRSHKPVDDAWSSHRCVVPWASAILSTRTSIYNAGGQRGNELPADVTEQEVMQLARAAAAVEAHAAEFVPHGRKEPLLPRSELLPVRFGINRPCKDDVEFNPLPDRILASLKKRRKRQTFGGLAGG